MSQRKPAPVTGEATPVALLALAGLVALTGCGSLEKLSEIGRPP